MTDLRRRAWVVAALALLLFSAGPAANGDAARAFLASTFGLAAADFARLDRGEVVARAAAAGDARDLATLGVVKARFTPAFYAERIADIVTFKKDDAVLQIGLFGRPPALRDVEGLTLDESDIRSLRDCRVGRCAVQLPAEAIERFHREIDWTRTDARERANGLMRQILVDYVGRYQQPGTATSMRYADRDDVTDVRNEFLSLAGSDAGGWGRFAILRRHLFEYPDVAMPEARDLVYWSKEVVGRRTVASVTHLAILPGTAGSPAAFTIGSKQIYGTHYFDASLGLTVLVRESSAEAPTTYVAYLNRSRVDIFGGMFGGVARKIVAAKARGTVAEQLDRLRTRLEREFAARGGGG